MRTAELETVELTSALDADIEQMVRAQKGRGYKVIDREHNGLAYYVTMKRTREGGRPLKMQRAK